MVELVNNIVCGDCVELLNEAEGRGWGGADLIFADPPFNIGYKYDKYKDVVKGAKYIAWTRDWMAACVNALKPSGSFYIAIGDDYAAHVRLIGGELGLSLRNWIIWHYTFGQQTKMKFARSHTHIFYFVKDEKNFTFNDSAVRVPSDRQLIYNDKRANAKGKLPDDVWNEYSRVCGTFNERAGWHPCQMPETVLTRIISVSSNSGDLVLDPFNGSGTTAAVAKMLGRKYAGIDISPEYVKNAKARLAELDKKDGSGDGLFPGFTQAERLELKQLYVDMAIDVRRILAEKKLLGIFTKQFCLRMGGKKNYDEEQITMGLMDLAKQFNLLSAKV